MYFYLGQMLGSFVTCYLVLRLFMFLCRKVRRKPNSFPTISLMGVLCLALSTILYGYGAQDEGPEPVFSEGFLAYLLPVTVATWVELFRDWRRSVRASS